MYMDMNSKLTVWYHSAVIKSSLILHVLDQAACNVFCLETAAVWSGHLDRYCRYRFSFVITYLILPSYYNFFLCPARLKVTWTFSPQFSLQNNIDCEEYIAWEFWSQWKGDDTWFKYWDTYILREIDYLVTHATSSTWKRTSQSQRFIVLLLSINMARILWSFHFLSIFYKWSRLCGCR
jgi:hypothetical protein